MNIVVKCLGIFVVCAIVFFSFVSVHSMNHMSHGHGSCPFSVLAGLGCT